MAHADKQKLLWQIDRCGPGEKNEMKEINNEQHEQLFDEFPIPSLPSVTVKKKKLIKINTGKADFAESTAH